VQSTGTVQSTGRPRSRLASLSRLFALALSLSFSLSLSISIYLSLSRARARAAASARACGCKHGRDRRCKRRRVCDLPLCCRRRRNASRRRLLQGLAEGGGVRWSRKRPRPWNSCSVRGISYSRRPSARARSFAPSLAAAASLSPPPPPPPHPPRFPSSSPFSVPSHSLFVSRSLALSSPFPLTEAWAVCRLLYDMLCDM